jgi:hypothetical protein
MFCASGLILGGTGGVGSRFHVLCARTRFRRYRGRRVPFSCFAVPDSFSALQRASGPVFMFCAPIIVFDVPSASGPVFMFCAPGLVFGGAECVGSCFHVLRAHTHFRRCSVRRVSFSYFALPDLFSLVPRASGRVFLFCAPGLVFSGTERVESRFHVLRYRTRFRWFRGRPVPFSCLPLPDMFRRYRGRRVPFSCFVLPGLFSAVPGASGPVFLFCSPIIIFGGAKCVGSRFHVLRSRTHFRRYLWRRVPISCFALPESFSEVPGASGPVFMFCVLGLVFGGTEDVGSRFHVLRS